MIEEKMEHTFEMFETKVRDSESASSKSLSCEDIKIAMATLRELVAPNWKLNLYLLLILY